ncbi:MAG TPA: nucleoside diphosphate kinase regulator [Syntrophales bacterium]|nr:nucleoside diphosphate kinase regulator [Syntrophales bacterium]HOD97716.1 nucleoside diphosphate kinase regulator [Syntrophales bacterium]HOH72929.1 nucleoside diphosphate kinase regulator [Syntrophales bacterium]HPN09107.1 nucleoside diphosphate kinase regulator [Syntrophales bacterium]HPX81226.1 nucleoside diphosphate kinase regulator [Syntrophales bacterium]
MTTEKRNIFITEKDMERLEPMVAGAGNHPNIRRLREELERAVIVPSAEIPADVVTMNSRVVFRELETGEETEATLVYPSQADVNQRRISILAPVGAALLGLSAGDEIQWPLPSGKKRTYKIISILYQPEAAGNYDL